MHRADLSAILRLMRVMALDYGTRAIGVAISDELEITVRPLTTLRVRGRDVASLSERIAALVVEHQVGAVVVGLPLRMDGTRGDAVARVERFAGKLRKCLAIPVLTNDERLTSRAADELLREQGVDARERRLKSDQYAAAIILQDYLARQERDRSTAQPPFVSLPELDA